MKFELYRVAATGAYQSHCYDPTKMVPAPGTDERLDWPPFQPPARNEQEEDGDYRARADGLRVDYENQIKREAKLLFESRHPASPPAVKIHEEEF